MLLKPTRGAARAGVLLTLAYGAGAGAVAFRPEGSSVATWWPAAGLCAALLLLSPRRWWPALSAGIVVALALANLTGGQPVVMSLVFGLCNALEALVVAGMLTRGGRGRFRLESPASFFRLLTACVMGALTLGASCGLVTAMRGEDWLDVVRTVAPAHLASTLVILPLFTISRDRRRRRDPSWEQVLQSAGLLVAVLAVFAPEHPYAIAFLTLPWLIWAALRFCPGVVSVQLLGLAVLSTGLTALGSGPFAVGARGSRIDPVLSAMQVQGFLICAVMLAVPTALASSQLVHLLRRTREERELTETMLDTTAALVVVTDREGTVLRINATGCRMIGYAAEEIVGRPIWLTSMVPPERVEIVHDLFAASDGSSIPGARAADVMTADGERLHVIWNNSILRDSDGQVSYAVFTGVDVTAERITSGMLQHLLEAPGATAVVGTDRHGRVTLYNRAAQEMLERPADLVLGQPLLTMVASPQAAQFLGRRPVLTNGRRTSELPDSSTSDWIWERNDGSHLTMSTTISTVNDSAGAPVGFLCVGRDVTEQRRNQELLMAALEKEREAGERLRALDAAKNDFVSTASHELRTPTTSIVGYTEMLLEGVAGEPSPEQVPMLQAIARNGSRLLAVATDLLVLSEQHGNDGTEARELVDLRGVVASAEEAVHPLLGERQLTVEFAVPPQSVQVEGNPAHLDRVLLNLLSNAIKFTPDGGSVCCSLTVEDDMAQLVVCDTGIGIPEEEQGELFTKFFRSSTAQERAIQGTGLGLSIVSSIVASHQGSIAVRSGHLKGTTFTVRLPLTRVGSRVLSSG